VKSNKVETAGLTISIVSFLFNKELHHANFEKLKQKQWNR
jgi:hypothetical protein